MARLYWKEQETLELILRIKMQEQEHQQSLYNKYFIYIVIYFVLEIRHKSCYIKTWVEQSVACIRSEFKSRATIDPVFKIMSLLSQAYSILTLLFHGLELLSSRPCDLCDLQPVVYTELILNIVASYCPAHLCYISVDFCWLLICFHYRILDWLWDHVCK